MNKKIKLDGVAETMLQTLYARAYETQKKHPKIQDAKACEIVNELDYDFKDAKKDIAMRSGVIARTILLDSFCTQYLQTHQDVTIINIACGLDTRCYRIQGYQQWYNLDLEETMHVRRMFFQETDRIHQISASCIDPSWPTFLHPTSNVLIIIEGLLMYFKEDEVYKLCQILDEHFEHMDLILESMSCFVVNHVKEKSIDKSNAKFQWGMDNGKTLTEQFPSFIHIEDISLVEGMKVLYPIYRFLAKNKKILNLSNKLCIYRK